MSVKSKSHFFSMKLEETSCESAGHILKSLGNTLSCSYYYISQLLKILATNLVSFNKNQNPHPNLAPFGSGAQKKPLPHFFDLSTPVGTFGFHRSQVLHRNTYSQTLPPWQYLLLLSKSHNLLQKLSIGVRYECDFKGSCKTRFWAKQQPSLAWPHGVSGGAGLWENSVEKASSRTAESHWAALIALWASLAFVVPLDKMFLSNSKMCQKLYATV